MSDNKISLSFSDSNEGGKECSNPQLPVKKQKTEQLACVRCNEMENHLKKNTISKSEHKRILHEASQDHATELFSVTRTYGSQIDKLHAMYQEEIHQLKIEKEEVINGSKEEINQLKTMYENEKEQMRSNHRKEIADFKAEHDIHSEEEDDYYRISTEDEEEAEECELCLTQAPIEFNDLDWDPAPFPIGEFCRTMAKAKRASVEQAAARRGKAREVVMEEQWCEAEQEELDEQNELFDEIYM